jgi:hypothetical protein
LHHLVTEWLGVKIYKGAVLFSVVVILVSLGCTQSVSKNNSPSGDLPAASSVEIVSRLELVPESEEFRTSPIQLFRSSSHYRPLTVKSTAVYTREFKGHRAARINPVGWELYRSTDLKSFKQGLSAYQKRNEYLNDIHEKLIFLVALMPKWLSTSGSEQIHEGYWKEFATHGPRDYEQWYQVVKSAAEILSRYDKVERYYEIWNEPDLFYWNDDLEAYLKLYRVTAAAIMEGDPGAKVGGAAVNGWDGRLEKSPGSDPVNLELIRYAKRESVPLDFISWHHFGTTGAPIITAKKEYEKACRDAGYIKFPEFMVSEWNVTTYHRGTKKTPAMLATMFLSLAAAEVDIHTISVWEDAHKDGSDKGYGIIRQDGIKKPAFYVYQLFDRLALESTGIAMKNIKLENKLEGERLVVISRNKDDTFSILMWDIGYDPPMAAALKYLLGNGMSQKDFKAYQSIEELEQEILQGKPRNRAYREQYIQAGSIYRNQPETGRLEILFPGHSKVEVLYFGSVKSSLQTREARVDGNMISCNFSKYEVLAFKVKLE